VEIVKRDILAQLGKILDDKSPSDAELVGELLLSRVRLELDEEREHGAPASTL
jgi:hypothetical protein